MSEVTDLNDYKQQKQKKERQERERPHQVRRMVEWIRFRMSRGIDIDKATPEEVAEVRKEFKKERPYKPTDDPWLT